MIRGLAIFLTVLALVVAGIPPLQAAGVMEMASLSGYAEAADMAVQTEPCCPGEHGQAPDQGSCDTQSWLGCAVQCGLSSPVFTPVSEIVLWLPHQAGRGTLAATRGTLSSDISPPLRPPRSSILV